MLKTAYAPYIVLYWQAKRQGFKRHMHIPTYETATFAEALAELDTIAANMDLHVGDALELGNHNGCYYLADASLLPQGKQDESRDTYSIYRSPSGNTWLRTHGYREDASYPSYTQRVEMVQAKRTFEQTPHCTRCNHIFTEGESQNQLTWMDEEHVRYGCTHCVKHPITMRGTIRHGEFFPE